MQDELIKNLDYLGLPHLKTEIYSMLENAAQQNTPLAEFFTMAICAEAVEKRRRSTERRISQAHFPQKKTLESFDWGHPDKINEELVRYLFTLRFAEDHKNIAFLGLPGLGKTHLMTAIGLHACASSYSVLYETAANIINRLLAARATENFMRVLKTYTKVDILCIDEIGYLPIDQHGANMLFQVISSRYERGSIILTSNKAFIDWGDIFNDSTITSAILDRLLHHCEVVTIEGKSYRMAARKK